MTSGSSVGAQPRNLELGQQCRSPTEREGGVDRDLDRLQDVIQPHSTLCDAA